ncbi:MAG TPA: hypothetical protein VGW78_05085 [Candidatus Babeliales bacterium]|nr:hypothetical protein [Candidatus Babeliales bacterium]
MNKRIIGMLIGISLRISMLASDMHTNNDDIISMFMRCQKDAISIALQSSKARTILEVTPEYSKVTNAAGLTTVSSSGAFISNRFLFDFLNKQCIGANSNEIKIDNVQKLEKHSTLYRTYLAAHNKIKCPGEDCAWFMYEGSPVPGNYNCWNTK